MDRLIVPKSKSQWRRAKSGATFSGGHGARLCRRPAAAARLPNHALPFSNPLCDATLLRLASEAQPRSVTARNNRTLRSLTGKTAELLLYE